MLLLLIISISLEVEGCTDEFVDPVLSSYLSAESS